MKKKTNTVRLGLFVTVAFAIFAISVYYIGNKQNMFGQTFSISSVFQNVKGLTKGNNVRYAGINVGVVEEIIILSDTTIQVDMELQKKVQQFLKKDAIASIATDGLVGNMIVNISPGNGKGAMVKDGDTIESYTRIATKDMMNTLGKTTENISILTLNLLEIAEKINQGSGSFATFLNDSIMATELQNTVRNLRQSSQHVKGMSQHLEQTMSKLDDGEGIVSYLLNDTTFEYQINQITDGLNTLIRNRTAPIMENLEASSADIAITSEELKTIIQEIDMEDGLINTLLEDPEVAEDLKQTMKNLNLSTEKLEENMEAMRHHFLFKRYFKKQEKKKQKEEEEKKKEQAEREDTVTRY